MKRKGIVCLLLLGLSFVAAAESETARKIRENSGGVLIPPGNDKSFLIMDMRGTLEKPETWKPFLSHQENMFNLPITLKYADPPKPGYDLYRTVRSFKTGDYPAVLMMVDDADSPGLSVFPEETMAVINVQKYRTDDPTKYSRRLTREIWRAFGLAMGAYANIPQGDVLKVVVKPEDLDRIPAPVISVARQEAVIQTYRKIDLRTKKPVSYATACRQGWAPAPTNDIQKAIWNRIHAAPKNPMKIEFDPKKGR